MCCFIVVGVAVCAVVFCVVDVAFAAVVAAVVVSVVVVFILARGHSRQAPSLPEVEKKTKKRNTQPSREIVFCVRLLVSAAAASATRPSLRSIA